MARRNTRVFNLDNNLVKINLPKAVYQVRKFLISEKPDIVHTHLLIPSIIGLNLAKWQGCKTVLTRHHSDAVHVLPSKIKRDFYLRLEYRNNTLADHIIVPSKMVRECVVDWEKTPNKKVTIIPYGQTSQRFDKITPQITAQKRFELGMNKQLSLVCVSRLFHRKGHKFLFEALEFLIKKGLAVKLYLVGTGDYKENLEQLAKELKITHNIEFLGWRDDVLEIIAAADVIVHPSLEDALSQSLIESLMLERPIIATDISGARDTLDDGKYGELVPPSDAKSIRNALEKLINNFEAAKIKGKRGKEYLLEYMDAQRVANEHLKIYQNILS